MEFFNTLGCSRKFASIRVLGNLPSGGQLAPLAINLLDTRPN